MQLESQQIGAQHVVRFLKKLKMDKGDFQELTATYGGKRMLR